MNARNLSASDTKIIMELAEIGRLSEIDAAQQRRLVRRGLAHKHGDGLVLAKGAYQAVLTENPPPRPPKGVIRKVLSWLKP